MGYLATVNTVLKGHDFAKLVELFDKQEVSRNCRPNVKRFSPRAENFRRAMSRSALLRAREDLVRTVGGNGG
ncbi:MAG: hypothetical protein WA624_12345, partial [Methylocella sp.]